MLGAAACARPLVLSAVGWQLSAASCARFPDHPGGSGGLFMAYLYPNHQPRTGPSPGVGNPGCYLLPRYFYELCVLQGRFEFNEGPSGKRNFDIKINEFELGFGVRLNKTKTMLGLPAKPPIERLRSSTEYLIFKFS